RSSKLYTSPGVRPFPYTTLFRSQFCERALQRHAQRWMRPGRTWLDARRLLGIVIRCYLFLPQLAAPSVVAGVNQDPVGPRDETRDRKSTRLNSSHLVISYAVFCL